MTVTRTRTHCIGIRSCISAMGLGHPPSPCSAPARPPRTHARTHARICAQETRPRGQQSTQAVADASINASDAQRAASLHQYRPS